MRPISPEDAAVFRVLLHGQYCIQGIRNADLRRQLMRDVDDTPTSRRQASARTSRLLRLLRAHGLVRKVSATRYYRVTLKGHAVMTTALKFRDTDIAVLAA